MAPLESGLKGGVVASFPEPEVVASGFDSPEGPAFDEAGSLYYVNWLTSSIVRIGKDGVPREIANTRGIPAGLAFHRDGTLYCADEGVEIHGIITIDASGRFTPFVATYQGRPLNGANDLVFDASGVLYFSDPWGSSAERPIGGFYRAFPDGRIEQIDTGLAFPNGVAINADETAVFLAETRPNRILRYALRADGTCGPRTLFATLTGAPGPDGMAFDAEGRLYVAQHGAGRVCVFNATGAMIEEIATPGRQPTNVAFGGANLDELYVTEVETASLYRYRIGRRGQPLFGGLQHR